MAILILLSFIILTMSVLIISGMYVAYIVFKTPVPPLEKKEKDTRELLKG
jgi:hypothetical protein